MSGPRTETTRAILAFITSNAPVPQASLNDQFRSQAAVDGKGVGSWLNGRLANMREAGYIEHTPAGWVAVAKPVSSTAAAGKRIRHRKPKASPAVATSVAEPRRISMFGPVYVPATQVLRAGSTDYAAAPSLINGETRSYRRGW